MTRFDLVTVLFAVTVGLGACNLDEDGSRDGEDIFIDVSSPVELDRLVVYTTGYVDPDVTVQSLAAGTVPGGWSTDVFDFTTPVRESEVEHAEPIDGAREVVVIGLRNFDGTYVAVNDGVITNPIYVPDDADVHYSSAVAKLALTPL